MILQSLAEYYQEQLLVDNPHYAPPGMELKRIHFVLVLSLQGQLVEIEQPGQKISVAKSRHRSGIKAPMVANNMWDSVGYVTGYGVSEKQHATALVQHQSFLKVVMHLHHTYPQNKTFAAVASFYSHYFEQLVAHPLWLVITAKQGHNLSFRLAGETLLAAQQPEMISETHPGVQHECMITGRQSTIARLHPKIYVRGGAPTGTKLISFTNGCGYDSYNKQGGENAPISVEITEHYAAALTALTQQNSKNCVVVGAVTLVFFTLPDSTFSKCFCDLIDPAVEADRNELLDRISDYAYSDKSESACILLALVPNATRLSVRLYLRTTLGKLCENILDFYGDIAIEHNCDLTDTIPLLLPLFSASPQSNIQKLPPQMIVDYLYAVVTYTPFPVGLQHELLNRQRVQKGDNIGVVSMLRCYVNRRTNSKNYIPMALDRENTNTGYLLGRMFAILERAQEMSTPGITFTLRDAYYPTASVTPNAVFNRLVGLSVTYFRRIQKPATVVYLKSQLSEVTEKLDSSGIPARLSPDDQSRFALGYFHQRQIYFTKRENDEQDNRK